MEPIEADGIISIVVTTFGTDSLYTQACLESIRQWKTFRHELIVVTHDESPLLRAYLDACASDGLIDTLVFAPPQHGHTRGFNLGVTKARGDVIFNVCNDILIGPSLIDDCAYILRNDRQAGIVGWHWYCEGAEWADGKIAQYALRDPNTPLLAAEHEANIRQAPWFTGRYFAGIGGPFWIQLCNTSFFGALKETLLRVGGGFSREYPHYWADDFLCYAVLDQGLDVRHFDRRYRRREFFHEWQYDHTDVADRRRHEDALRYEGPFLKSISLINGGMSTEESGYLHLLGRAIPQGATVTNVGVWQGSSAIVLLDALRDKQVTFHFIDCFDLPGISALSGQPAATGNDFLRNISGYIGRRHTIHVHRANTLEMREFPASDFVFVDAGHTQECIAHDASLARACLKPGGTAAFHDYDCPAWPAVKPTLDALFSDLEIYKSVAVHRTLRPMRQAYHWPQATGRSISSESTQGIPAMAAPL